jgi:hypothetical protein
MLVNQIIGRAWRLGQTEVVVVYNLVCDQTVDCLMTDYAQGKGSMLEQFLDTRHGRGWFLKRFQGMPPLNVYDIQTSKRSLYLENPPLKSSLRMGQEQTQI